MLLFLIVILLFNVVWAYSAFKNFIAPPVLMGIGMLAAAFIVSMFYNEWQLDVLLPETVFYLGGGTLFFTAVCVFMSTFMRLPKPKEKKEIEFNSLLNSFTLTIFYGVVIIVGLAGFYMKLNLLRGYFGNLVFADLVFEFREEGIYEGNFSFPGYVKMISSVTSAISTFTIWLLTLSFMSKEKPNRFLQALLIGQFIVAILHGMVEGAKGAIFSIVLGAFIIGFTLMYAKRGTFKIKNSLIFKTVGIFLLAIVSFKGLSLAMGRQVEGQSNLELVAEYCGAEIKNFDIYMHSGSSDFRSKHFGAVTFHCLYEELGSKYGEADSMGFNSIGTHTLGNVYTQFYAFHRDFGGIGCFLMPLFIAVIAMLLYKKSLEALKNPHRPNLYLFVYASVGMAIFMSFFSCKFTETNFRIGYLQKIFFMWGVIFGMKHFVLNKKLLKTKR